MLLDRGCRIDVVNSRHENTLNILCCRTSSRPNHLLGLKLLEMGADPDEFYEDNSKSPFLNLCNNRPSMKFVAALIEYGVDIDETDEDGKTALHQAVCDGNLRLVKILIKLGADVKACDRKYRYPIHHVMIGIRNLHFSRKKNYSKYYKIIKVLLAAGADIDTQTKKGVTAIHYVRYPSQLRVLKRFAKLGADIFKCEHEGRDLESRAKARNLNNVVERINTLKTSQ